MSTTSFLKQQQQQSGGGGRPSIFGSDSGAGLPSSSSSASSSDTKVETAMEDLIPVINKLQDVFNATGSDPVDLPQIVVVGSQSAGKSSVLESIVGRDFLPRGSGIVTRRPLVLQLINLPWDDSSGKDEKFAEWGEFLHKPNEMFYDFNEIRNEIVRETDRLTGSNKGISNTPINLKIYSPHVLNLTLVDLPGMTKVPVGDQPKDIEIQIRRMCLQYIQRPASIILAVTAANSDMANSDSLQLAKEVDPEGLRTIGVLTKIDIMDKGTDALDMLMGRVIPLRLGFIGCVNRSQQDIISKKPIRKALKDEMDFFTTHRLYRTVASRCGTQYLAKTLSKILMNHIRNCLPELKSKINKMISDTQSELDSYGDSLYDGGSQGQGALLLQILTKFSQDYRDAIDGKSTDLALNELYGGARINFIFNEVYGACLDDVLAGDGLSQHDIRTAIRNATGPRAALFVPEESFELLVRQQIARLEEPSLQCVDLVFDELQRIVAQLESKELLRFQVLRDRVQEVVNNLLVNCRKPTKDMIKNLISIETAYINTNHPDFIGGSGALNKVLESMAKGNNPAAAQLQAQQQQQQQQLQLQQQQQQQLSQQQSQQKSRSGGSKVSSSSSSSKSQQNVQQNNPLMQSNQQPSSNSNNPGFLNMFFGGKDKDNSGGTNYAAYASNFQNPFAQNNNQQQQQQLQQAQQQQQQLQSKLQQQQAFEQNRQQGIRQVQQSSTQSSFAMRSSRRPGQTKLDQVPATIKATSTPSERERFETELIQNLLMSYFNIVRKSTKDSVPKTIMHFLVGQSKRDIQNELVSKLYKEGMFDELLEESPAIATRRSSCKAMLEVLRRASSILNEVRDFHGN